jgi:hypothetical protein
VERRRLKDRLNGNWQYELGHDFRYVATQENFTGKENIFNKSVEWQSFLEM